MLNNCRVGDGGSVTSPHGVGVEDGLISCDNVTKFEHLRCTVYSLFITTVLVVGVNE